MSEDQLAQLQTLLETLEERQEFTDDAAAVLSREVAEQQRQIFELERRLKLLEERLQARTEGHHDPSEEPPPPHY